MIPKIIWSYWNSENVPKLIARCFDSWKQHHPDYNIILLNENSYKEYVSIPKQLRFIDSNAHFADILRIYLIEKYGGFWFDSSIMCYNHIENIFDLKKNSEFYGYYMDNFMVNKSMPVIENWLFGAPLHSKFIQKWKAELLRVNIFSDNSEYVQQVVDEGINIQNIPYPEYLAMHIAAQAVIQRHPRHYNLQLKSVYDGPFKLLGDANWDIKEAMKLLCNDKEKKYKTSFIKFRGMDRNLIMEDSIKCLE